MILAALLLMTTGTVMILETDTEIVIKGLPGQLETLACPDREAYFIGGFGCGKTDGLAMFLDQEAHLYRNNYICAAAATYPQLQRSTIRKTLAYFDRRRLPYKYNKNDKEIKLLDGCGSSIVFQSFDVPLQHRQGPEFGAAAIDEAETCTWDDFRIMRSRVRKLDASRKVRIFGNPPPEHHWITKRYRDGKHYFYIADTRENITLPPDYIEDLLEMYPPGSYGYRRYVCGEIGVPLEGAVFPEFSSKFHLVDEKDVPWDRIVGYVNGLDFGYNHPTAFLVGAVTDDDVLYIVGEHYAPRLLLEEHCEHIRAIYLGGPIFRDHDAQDAAEMAEMGIETLLATKDLSMGLDLVRKRLVRKTIKIVRGAAPNLVRELGVYLWHPTRDEPMKKDDHAPDALRYMVAGLDLASSEENEIRSLIYGV